MSEPVHRSDPESTSTAVRRCAGCGQPLPADADQRRTTCDQRCRTLASLPTQIGRALADMKGRITPDMASHYRSVLWQAANELNTAQTQKTGRYVGHKRGNGRRGER